MPGGTACDGGCPHLVAQRTQGGRIFTPNLPTTPGQLTRDDVASAASDPAMALTLSRMMPTTE